ncbi:MAG: DUF4258 domain-containing protein [Deltaproteobacteria bacterium]|nr:DUF4258 domain-containing protein [Deltaproteobacteria bacterium]
MYPRVLAKIRNLVKQGDYVLSIHAENELANDNLTEQDLEAAMLNGTIIRRERDPIGRGKYVIEGKTQKGKGLTVVAQFFQTRQLVVIITAYET